MSVNVYVDGTGKALVSSGEVLAQGYKEVPRYEVVNGVAQQRTVIPSNAFSGITEVDDYALYYAYAHNSQITSVDLSSLTTVSGSNGCQNMFMSCSHLTSVDLSSLTTVSGTNGCQAMFSSCTGLTSVDLSSLTTVSGTNGCQSMFNGCTGLTSVDLSSLTTISGSSAYQSVFSGCTSLTSIDLSSLTIISGTNGCLNMFNGCTGLTSIDLSSLTTVSGSSACSNMFQGCTNLTSVSFSALNTTSFGSYKNQFSNMMIATGSTKTHTLHFPSNMESTIQGLTGYPLFGGTSGYVVLAFDLPATSESSLDGGGGTN